MIGFGIPEWFYRENETANIWKHPFDSSLVEREVTELATGLNDGWRESDVQEFLKPRPYLFDGLYRHGHGTFVFSEFKFGTEYIADWVIGSGHSGGIMWDLIELECPQSLPFMKDGRFAKPTRKGINQIRDWRRWIGKNIAYVEKSRSQHGLGLFDISARASGIVVVGRRSLYSSHEGVSRYNEARAMCSEESQINVISYDTLIERMRFYIDRLKKDR